MVIIYLVLDMHPFGISKTYRKSRMILRLFFICIYFFFGRVTVSIFMAALWLQRETEEIVVML